MSRRKGSSRRENSEVEEALVERLRKLDWPRPTAEVKERCLEDILERMAEMKKERPHEVRRVQVERRAHGFGERHSLTRSVPALSHRQPLSAPRRPVRVATVLW